MSSTARELVECAEELMRNATDEPQFRAVCSRAYYGAYHAAYAFHRRLRAPGTVRQARGRHEQLIEQLCNPMISLSDEHYALSKAIGGTLRTLREARVTADYHLSEHINQALAAQSATLATTILKSTT